MSNRVHRFTPMIVGGFLVVMLHGPANADSVETVAPPIGSVDYVGRYNSLVLDGSGYPVISYFNDSKGDLEVVNCNDANCSGGDESIESVDTTGVVGFHTSIRLDSNGYPVVSYWLGGIGNRVLRVLHCNDPDCSGGDESIENVDTAETSFGSTSLELDTDGYPVVGYMSDNELRVLHCNDVNCAGGDESIEVVDATPYIGEWSSLALDGNGYPVVSYYQQTDESLNILHCNDENCAGGDESIETVETGNFSGIFSSIALDANGYPVVSYSSYAVDNNNDLKVLHCNDENCNGGDEIIYIVDDSGATGVFNSLVLDGSGFPVVSYRDSTNKKLKVLHCLDVNCSTSNYVQTIETYLDNDYGWYTSLVLDSSGYPVVSYGGNYSDSPPNLRLKLLRCTDANCINVAPIAHAGPDYTGLPNVPIALNGSGSSDSDNDPLTYDWSANSARLCSVDDRTLVSPVLTCAVAGNSTVRLTVDDGVLVDRDTANVEILTQEQGVADLQGELSTLVNEGILTEGQARGLGQPLDNALRSLDKGKTAAACSQLQDFIDKVYEKTPTPLEATTAADLIAEAEALRTSIGC